MYWYIRRHNRGPNPEDFARSPVHTRAIKTTMFPGRYLFPRRSWIHIATYVYLPNWRFPVRAGYDRSVLQSGHDSWLTPRPEPRAFRRLNTNTRIYCWNDIYYIIYFGEIQWSHRPAFTSVMWLEGLRSIGGALILRFFILLSQRPIQPPSSDLGVSSYVNLF